MNKYYRYAGVALLAILAGFLVAQFVGNDKNESTNSRPTPTTRPAPTTATTEPDNSELIALCYESYNTIQEGLTSISDGVELLPYADSATAQEFIATAREFVSTAKVTVNQCSFIDPVQSATILDGLTELDAALRSLGYYL